VQGNVVSRIVSLDLPLAGVRPRRIFTPRAGSFYHTECLPSSRTAPYTRKFLVFDGWQYACSDLPE
jgi:hypothetical protein